MVVLKFLVVVVLVKSIYCDTAIKCTEEFCERFREDPGCPELSEPCRVMNSTHHGIHLPYPDVCNCCEYCLINILEGGSCTQRIPGLPAPVDICGPGLTCAKNSTGLSTCQKMSSVGNSECTKAQKFWDERRKAGTVGFLQVRPNCDDDGFYKPAHCIPGSICYCLSPTGERIFGEQAFLSSSDEIVMTCGCSINDWKARQSVDFLYWEDKKMQIFTARCTETGFFDELQCMLGDDGNCNCVEATQGYPNVFSEIVKVRDIKEGHPRCFDPKRHKPGQYTTTCEYMKLYRNLQISRTNLFINPNCQPDGMFSRIQTTESQQICVDPQGNQIFHNYTNQIIYFGADINSDEAQNMTCNCARTLWLLSQTNTTELPKCTNSGNFDPLQCRRNKCYCVNENGDQTKLEVDIKDINNLKGCKYENDNKM